MNRSKTIGRQKIKRSLPVATVLYAAPGFAQRMVVADPKKGASAGPTAIASGVATSNICKIDRRWFITRMTQEETVLSPAIATPEQIRFNALTARARATERRKTR